MAEDSLTTEEAAMFESYLKCALCPAWVREEHAKEIELDEHGETKVVCLECWEHLHYSC